MARRKAWTARRSGGSPRNETHRDHRRLAGGKSPAEPHRFGWAARWFARQDDPPAGCWNDLQNDCPDDPRSVRPGARRSVPRDDPETEFPSPVAAWTAPSRDPCYPRAAAILLFPRNRCGQRADGLTARRAVPASAGQERAPFPKTARPDAGSRSPCHWDDPHAYPPASWDERRRARTFPLGHSSAHSPALAPRHAGSFPCQSPPNEPADGGPLPRERYGKSPRGVPRPREAGPRARAQPSPCGCARSGRCPPRRGSLRRGANLPASGAGRRAARLRR